MSAQGKGGATPPTGTNPLYDAILAGRARGDGTLLETADGRTVDDASFLELAAGFARALADAGAAPGDRIAVQVDKSWQALALYVGCLKGGFAFLPLNTAYTVRELEYFVGDAEPAALVVAPDSREAATPIAGGATVLTLDADGGGTLADAARAAIEAGASAGDPAVPRESDDLAAILYTSGTTGRSKGAMLTQGNLLSNASTLVDAWGFTERDVLLHQLPIFHTHGLFVACHTSLLSGARMLFHRAFDVDALIGAMPRATVLMGVPTFYVRLLADPRFDRALASSMRLFVSGSAPLLAETHRAFEERTGQRILERYGMTETNMNCSNPYEGERRAGTVGPPLPGVEARVLDGPFGAPVERGGTGTLHVRGPNVFAGYWRMPDKTAEELGEDGWFVTGDLASVDDDGYVTIVGRGKDLVIAGGYNVYPKEVESAIDELPGVVESAVVGAPHPDLGEAVVGFVVVDGGASGQAPDGEALLEALGDRIARYKRPRRLWVVDELPRNTMGKVQKNALRERVADLFSPSGESA